MRSSKPGFPEFLQRMWLFHGFSHDFQLPAAPPYSADSAKPCRAAAGRVCAKRLEQQKGRKIGILPEKVGI